MWDKKKLASMMVIGMAAMCMLNGCQKKKAQPESAQTETAQSETQAAQTEAVELYTSESNSFPCSFRILSGQQLSRGLKINGPL